ncbi:PH domain-containing protein [Haloferax sp. MBLA0076]|uniref:PH domain-containing protein n=1 Tax=Haloferax litoreum TaxID=2666140 RepID=A0A6A8GJX5_9EURY|nr:MULTISPECIES: PH domain-containing protein [Haloferax]KAB1194510.1 PH domain-containing protein [Haloferax sp. CBA1148]MRX23081.1 PH domain-containing protein [Haloferax litoreum]
MTVDEWMARAPDEVVVWEGRPRAQTIIPSLVVGVVIVAGAIAGATVTNEPLVGLVGVFGVFPPVWSYARVTNTRFVVTDRALYRKTGVLSRNVQRVSLDRVQNSTFSQGIAGSLFDYGTVTVEAAGGGRIQFENVNDPRAVRTEIDRRLDRDEIPGTIDQWTAVLDEVRALRTALR